MQTLELGPIVVTPAWIAEKRQTVTDELLNLNGHIERGNNEQNANFVHETTSKRDRLLGKLEVLIELDMLAAIAGLDKLKSQKPQPNIRASHNDTLIK